MCDGCERVPQSAQCGIGHQTIVDRHHVVAAVGTEPECSVVIDRPTHRGATRVDRKIVRAVEHTRIDELAEPHQRLQHDVVLDLPLKIDRSVLQVAPAATRRDVRAGRLDTPIIGFENSDDLGARVILRLLDDADGHELTRQGPFDEHHASVG